jgi:ribosomal protein S18 acetylase RimI-like enzyme
VRLAAAPFPKPTLTIRTFRSDDAAAVRRLFVNGQLDFARGTHLEEEVRRYIQRSLADDLADISGHYQPRPGDNFWMAQLNGEVKGMVGVQGRSNEEAELRRMSVAGDSRRQGIGRRLLETVEDFCQGLGYRRISLSTVTQLQPAIAMYRSYGFALTGQEEYGKIVVQHYVKLLDHRTK